MKRSLTSVGGAISVGLLLSGHAAVLRADPILISDGRYVVSEVSLVPGTWIRESRAPDVPFGAFDTNLQLSASVGSGMARATAFQQSVIRATRFTGMGVSETIADAGVDVVGAGAVALFAVTFNLLTPHTYHFSGDFGRSGNGFVEFEIAFAGEGSLGEGQDRGTHGVLGPGEHEFYIWALTSAYGYAGGEPGYARASYDVDLSLQPVPEPASGALLAIGLAGLIVRRRRRDAVR